MNSSSMKIYKFIQGTSEPYINYIKLPEHAVMHCQGIYDSGQTWMIMLDLDFWNKNFEEIFPKKKEHYQTQYTKIGDKMFLFLYNITSYEWEPISDEEFNLLLDEYVRKYYLVENRRDRKEWDEEIEVSSWQGGLDVLFTEWKDDDHKVVKVRKFETIHTPVSVTRITEIKQGVFHTINISWKNKFDGSSWGINKHRVMPEDLYHPSNWENEIKDIKDASLYEEMKNKYINLI